MNGVGNESDDYKVIYFYWSTVAHFYTAFFKFNTTYSFSIAWYLINLTATFFLCQVVPFLLQIIIIPLQWRYTSLMEDMRRILFLTIAFVCSQSELFSSGKSKFRGQMTWRPHKSICQRLQTLLELQPTDHHKGKRHRMLQLKKCYTDGMIIPLILILTFTWLEVNQKSQNSIRWTNCSWQLSCLEATNRVAEWESEIPMQKRTSENFI